MNALSSLAAVLLIAGLGQSQELGEVPAPPQVAGEAPATPVFGPLTVNGTVPAAYKNKFGTANNSIPFSWSPIRYQQVFRGSEMPKALRIVGLGLRQDEAFTSYKGQTIDVEIRLGYSRRSESNLSTAFSTNFDVGAPVLVLPRSTIKLPDMKSSKPTDPQYWLVQVPSRRPSYGCSGATTC